jgi:predicted transposase/invertase (TIGR01784 family)
LIKVSKFGNKVKNKLDEWIYFLKNSEVREDFTAQGLAQAKEKLDEIKMSETERKAYQRYLKSLRDIASQQHTLMVDAQEWMKKGEEVGMEKKGIEIARNLKQIGLAISDIAKVTGLSEEEIEKL